MVFSSSLYPVIIDACCVISGIPGKMTIGGIPESIIFFNSDKDEGRLVIILAPSEILSKLILENISSDQSNRLCFAAERYNILQNLEKSLESLRRALEISPDNSVALHLMGTMLSTQNSSDCINLFEQSLESNKRCYLSYNGLGNFYLKTNQFEKAENFYNKAIEINPKRSAKIYKNRAYVREKLGNISGVKDDLKKYLKIFPRAPDRGIIEQAIREL